jgi:hypothetical protein
LFVAFARAHTRGVATLQVSVRASAVSLAVSGLFLGAATPWHPSIFTRPVHEAVHATPAWTVLHAVMLAAALLALVGAAGLVAVHDGRQGRLGTAGLIAVLVGVGATSGLMATEATVFPILADHDPELLALSGPLMRSPLFIAAGILAAGWFLGFAMIGAAAARARLFGRGPGLALAITALAFLTLAGPFVPVAGPAAAVAFGATQVWWAWLLWRKAFSPADARAATVDAGTRAKDAS